MRRYLVVALCPAFIASACDGASNDPANTPAKGGMVISAEARIAAESVPLADVATQTRDNAVFAFALYAELAKADGNLFFSPHSISTALAMAWAGAAGDTATAMTDALDLSMPSTRVHGALNALDAMLASRATPTTNAVGGTDQSFTLTMVNALWGQVGLEFQAPFLDTLAANYGAGVRTEDFAATPDAARGEINAWVSDNTHGKIPELLGSGSITPATRVVLTNAVYFKAPWATPFAPTETANAAFHALDGSTPTTPFMHQTLETSYAVGDGWKALELPYTNSALTLTVIVPDQGKFASVEGMLSADLLATVIAAETSTRVALALPKFTTTTAVGLRVPLTALGMGVAFTGAADFSAIDGQRDLYISDVVHQATLTVDEAGTEAAAATAVVFNRASVEATPTPLTIDRPFIFVLRDKPTGAILFVGRVVAP